MASLRTSAGVGRHTRIWCTRTTVELGGDWGGNPDGIDWWWSILRGCRSNSTDEPNVVAQPPELSPHRSRSSSPVVSWAGTPCARRWIMKKLAWAIPWILIAIFAAFGWGIQEGWDFESILTWAGIFIGIGIVVTVLIFLMRVVKSLGRMLIANVFVVGFLILIVIAGVAVPASLKLSAENRELATQNEGLRETVDDRLRGEDLVAKAERAYNMRQGYFVALAIAALLSFVAAIVPKKSSTGLIVAALCLFIAPVVTFFGIAGLLGAQAYEGAVVSAVAGLSTAQEALASTPSVMEVQAIGSQLSATGLAIANFVITILAMLKRRR